MVFVLVPLLSACGRTSSLAPLKITGFELKAHDPALLGAWYEAYLGLTPIGEAQELMLTGKGLHVTIKPALPASQPPRQSRSPGFFKIGFSTNQLDSLFDTLKARGNDFRGDIYFDNSLQTRSFIALDPEGNRVQFFEDSQAVSITPYFFSFMALDFDNTLAWCETALCFTETANLDLPDRGLSIRLLEKDHVLLELIGDANMKNATTAPTGIGSVTLNRTGKRMGDNPLIFNSAD